MDDAATQQRLADACLALCGSERAPLMLALVAARLGSIDGKTREIIIKKLRLVSSALSQATRAALEVEFACTMDNGRPPQDFALPSSTPSRLLGSCSTMRRLSDCDSLWRRTCEFYHTKKAAAWTSGAVPFHISSSAFIAAHYASVIHGFIVESESRLHTRTTDICYIFDVGCGCGLLGVQVARELKKLGMRGFCVVLADIDISAALAQIQLSDASARWCLRVSSKSAGWTTHQIRTRQPWSCSCFRREQSSRRLPDAPSCCSRTISSTACPWTLCACAREQGMKHSRRLRPTAETLLPIEPSVLLSYFLRSRTCKRSSSASWRGLVGMARSAVAALV